MVLCVIEDIVLGTNINLKILFFCPKLTLENKNNLF